MRWLLLTCAIFLLACNDCAKADAAQTDRTVTAAAGPSEHSQAQTTQAEQDYTTRFNATNAWQHLLRQVELGFRVPGSPGHKACRTYLQQELLRSCDVVEEQAFTVNLPTGLTKMYNIIGRFNLESRRRILLCAHWDPRPTADYKPQGQRDKPIPGPMTVPRVAVLLELARLLEQKRRAGRRRHCAV
jgi:hypothetical protein